MEKKQNWADYYEQTEDTPPTPLLVKAFDYTKNPTDALEIGAGSPRDTQFLLEKGLKVIAIDPSDASKKLFDGFEKNSHFTFEYMGFEDFDFKENSYDLISAQRVLHLAKDRESLSKVFSAIKGSLKVGGVFTGTFFGPKDTWRARAKEMTFLEKSEVEEILEGLKVEFLAEKEIDSETAKGTPHHWHIFYVIAVKE